VGARLRCAVTGRAGSSLVRMDKLPRFVAILAGLGFLAGGLWAFVDARSFFDSVATFEPFNEHFLHDIGAFQIGIAATLLLAASMKDALYVALAGATVGQIVHVVAHTMDRDQGQNQGTMIPVLALLAGLMLVATLVRARQIRR
jgi:ABC-type xylose transport system permease subunit